MRKIMILMCIAALSVVACKKDSDSNPENNPVVGVWEGVHAKMVIYGEDREVVSETDIQLAAPNFVEVHFNRDLTFTSEVRMVEPEDMEENVKAKGTYEVKGGTIILKQEGEDDLAIPYSLSGGDLSLVLGEGGASTMTILLRKKE